MFQLRAFDFSKSCSRWSHNVHVWIVEPACMMASHIFSVIDSAQFQVVKMHFFVLLQGVDAVLGLIWYLHQLTCRQVQSQPALCKMWCDYLENTSTCNM